MHSTNKRKESKFPKTDLKVFCINVSITGNPSKTMNSGENLEIYGCLGNQCQKSKCIYLDLNEENETTWLI